MPQHVESEFKLRASVAIDVAAVDATLLELGVACRLRACRQHVDTYFDDKLGSLRAAGIGLRLRTGAEGRRLACKAQARHEGNLVVRDEIEADWHSQDPPRTAVDLPPTLRDAVQPFVLDHPLAAHLQLIVQRDVRMLTEDGVDLCELVVDDVQATANGRTAHFQEIELEVCDDVAASERIAHCLRDRLPVEFTTTDKPTWATSLLGIERPRKPAPDDLAMEPTGRAVLRHLQTELVIMRQHEVGVRAGNDPEDLHQMRLATRRMRVLVRAFRDLWPQAIAARLLAHFGETGRQLGSVRDLDVLLEQLDGQTDELPPPLRPAGHDAIAWISARRTAARESLRGWLRDPARLRSLERCERDLAAFDADGAVATDPIYQTAGAALARAVKRLRRLAGRIPGDLPIEPAHGLRLAAKRVRYLAERFRDLPDMEPGKALRAVIRVQQRFGLVCDHEFAAARLCSWLHEAAAGSRDSDRATAALGGLATLHMRAAQRARAGAREALAKLDRKRVWRRLHGSSKRTP